MPKVTVEFKFAIGDLVVPLVNVVTVENGDAWQRRDYRPMQVAERIIQECPGGTQIKYLLYAGGDCHSNLILEQCLVGYAEALARQQAAIDKQRVEEQARRQPQE